jgi:hypothetical protein
MNNFNHFLILIFIYFFFSALQQHSEQSSMQPKLSAQFPAQVSGKFQLAQKLAANKSESSLERFGHQQSSAAGAIGAAAQPLESNIWWVQNYFCLFKF